MPLNESDLPDEIQAATAQSDQARLDRLATIGKSIGKKRDEAVKARRESGIEEIWRACEEAYQSLDAVNRGSEGGSFEKPTSMDGPLVSRSTPSKQGAEVKSKVYIPLTRRYVDMAAAKVGEIVLPIDDKAFGFDATPVPELINAQSDPTPVMGPNGQPIAAQMPQPAGAMPPGAPMGPPGSPAAPAAPPGPLGMLGAAAPAALTVGQLASAKIKQAADAAEKAEQQIYDWQIESNRRGEVRKVIHDAARLGTGVLKGPVAELRRARSVSKTADGFTLKMMQKTAPGSRWVNPWNFFPAPACGEDVHTGDYVIERDYISESQLLDLKEQVTVEGDPIYLADQIDLVVDEGPDKAKKSDATRSTAAEKATAGRYEIWYWTGSIQREDIIDLNAVGASEVPETKDRVHAVLTLVNDVVIRATLNPLESGRFPYHPFPWSRRADSWTGVGVAEQVCTPQRMVNAGTRELLNNAGKSAGSQWVIDKRAIIPADNSWVITPDKVWWMTGDGVTDDVRKVMTAIQIPNIGNQLLALLQYAYKTAEEACNIPLVSQGQQGPQDPQTFGQAELQNSNANTLLRSIGYDIDDKITVLETDLYYEWLLLDPDVPDDAKGDFQVNARGTSALVEKAIQEQVWVQMLSVALNPAYGLDPGKVAEQVLISKRLNPVKVQLTDEQKAAAAQQPPPEAPMVTAAKIRAASDQAVAGVRSQVDNAKTAAQSNRDAQVMQAENERTQLDHAAKMAELQLEERLAVLKYATQEKVSLQEVKAALADTQMKLATQKDLSLADQIANLHMHHNPTAPPNVITPPTEPVGRAPSGQSFAA